MRHNLEIRQFRRRSGKSAHPLKTRRVDRHEGFFHVHVKLFRGAFKDVFAVRTVVLRQNPFLLQFGNRFADVPGRADSFREETFDAHLAAAERRNHDFVFCSGPNLLRDVHAFLPISRQQGEGRLLRRGRGERIGCKNGSPVRRDADEVFRRLNVSADVHEVGQQLRSVAQRVG